MRIAIDARELAGRPTGVGRYLSQLLTAWSALPAAANHHFILCAPEPVRAATGTLPASLSVAGGHGTMWEQLVLPRLLRAAEADVLFAPGYTGPVFAQIPMVVAVHDVSFAAHPEWFSWREGWRRRTLTRLAARRAARVLTISDFSKREIIRLFGIEPSKIDVTYLGVTPLSALSEHVPTSAPRMPLASNSRTVLFVGSVFNRRHILEVIDGFARVARRHPDLRLELVGENRTKPHVDLGAYIAGTGMDGRITARSYVSDDTLASLYRGAAAFVFLSEYEGFGLTPLEALAAGVPIVVLDTDVSREIYGPAAIYVHRADPALIERALERAVFDETERNSVMLAADAVLQRYSWPECAHRTLQVLLASSAA